MLKAQVSGDLKDLTLESIYSRLQMVVTLGSRTLENLSGASTINAQLLRTINWSITQDSVNTELKTGQLTAASNSSSIIRKEEQYQ